MPRAEGTPPPGLSTQPLRDRAADLRDESRSLRDEAARLHEQTDALTRSLVMTVLEVDSRRGTTAEDTFSFHAGLLPAAVGLARGRLRFWLERAGVDPEDATDVVLACSEACANAVEHPVDPSRHAFEVSARCTPGAIELSVRDFGSWRDERPGGHRGRGLGMIRQLMDHAEIVTGENETTVLMRRARRQAA